MEAEAEILCEKRGRGGSRHAEPAEGAQRPDARHGARDAAGAGCLGCRSHGNPHRRQGRGREGVLRRRRHPPPDRLGLAPAKPRRRWPSGARNTSSTPSSRIIPSRTSRSSTASSWAAASVCRSTAATGWRASVTCLPCRRSAIGFFPDVGATYALPRLPGAMGRYIALTGERIKRADGMMLGLATHAVGGADFDALIDHLTAGEAGRTGLGDFRGRSRRGAFVP